MQSLPGTQANTRRAALLLHALPAADQRWLLKRLPEASRSSVLPLLAELRDLGMPRVPVEAVLGGSADSPSVEAALDHLRPQQVVEALAGEPPVLVARVLQMRQWPWTDTVVKRLASPVKGRSAGEVPPAGPSLQEALTRALAAKVSAQQGQAGSRRTGARWLGFFTRARQ